MRINTNMAALNAWRTMTNNSGNLQKSLERLSSGYRLNRAADDAAGLAVSEKMNAQIRGLGMATRNTQDAISMVQTAEGGASKLQEMMQRMRELAVQAGSDTLQDSDRAKLQEEFTALQQEITRTANTVTYNNRELINGASGNRATVIGGGTIGDVQVTSAATASGTYTFDVTQLATDNSWATTNSKNASNAAIDFSADPANDTLTDVFGGAFTGTSELTFTQEGKTITIDLTASTGLTVNAFVDHVNDEAAAAGMAFTIAIDGTGLKVSSNVDGTHGDVSVAETINAAGTRTFGFAETASQNAKATITDGDGNVVSDSTYVFRGNTFVADSGSALTGVNFTAVSASASNTQVTFVRNNVTFQIGANSGEEISTSFGDLRATNLGIAENQIDISDRASAKNALGRIDTALSTVSSERAKMGATQNRLENTIANLQTQSENLTAANSRIRDLDMASEMAQFTKFQILSQASTAMLAQANQITQGVLSLLR